MAIAQAPAPSQRLMGDLVESLRPHLKEWRFSLYLLRRSPLAMVGGLMVLGFTLLAIFGPMVATHPFSQDLSRLSLPPSTEHPMGTTSLGQDILQGVIQASRLDMAISLVVVGIAIVIGVGLGVVSGYIGGFVDEVVMRVTDVFLSIPALILAIAVAAVLGRTIENLMLAITITWWPAYTRLVRGQALSLRENQYVEAARAVGASEWRIIFRHLLPNTIAPVTVQATLDIGSVVLVAAALGFIGFGAGPTTPEWGAMISRGFEFLATSGYWWQVTFPGLMIFFFVMAFNLFGDGLRDVMDPRLRR